MEDSLYLPQKSVKQITEIESVKDKGKLLTCMHFVSDWGQSCNRSLYNKLLKKQFAIFQSITFNNCRIITFTFTMLYKGKEKSCLLRQTAIIRIPA